jgi:hypothetical protein
MRASFDHPSIFLGEMPGAELAKIVSLVSHLSAGLRDRLDRARGLCSAVLETWTVRIPLVIPRHTGMHACMYVCMYVRGSLGIAVYDFPFCGGRSMSLCRSEQGNEGRCHSWRITMICPLLTAPARRPSQTPWGKVRRLGDVKLQQWPGARDEIVSSAARLTLGRRRAIARVSL